MPIGTPVNTIADFETSLASKVAVGATTATLTSATDNDGVALPSGTYSFTIDRKSTAKKEYICCTLNGTALTNIKTLKRGTGDETAGFAKEHRQGAEVIISDFVAIKRIQDVLETGYGTATGPTSDYQLATKKYVDDTAFGGITITDKTTIAGLAGEDLTIGQLVYLKSTDSRWWLASAATAATCEGVLLGIAQATTSVGASIAGGVVVFGLDSNMTGLTTNTIYYASDTPGAISSTPGTKEVTLGIATATTKLMFTPKFNQELTEDEQDALQGSQGVANNLNRYITQDNIYSSDTDQTQTTQNDVIIFGAVDATTKYNKIYQSFIPAKTKIRGVKLYKSANTGTFTGTVTISLYASSAGSPTGSTLATVTLTNTEYLAFPVGEFSAIFSSEYSSLVVGNLYWISIESSTADDSNHPNLGINTAGGYASGSTKFWNTTDSYTAIATLDLYFKTLQGFENQIPGKVTKKTVLTQTIRSLGDATSQFDISKPAGTTYRYTYDGTGTDPAITALTVPTGSTIYISDNTGFAAGNKNQTFTVTGSGANYFEVTNAGGAVESNKKITDGYVAVELAGYTWTPTSGARVVEAIIIGAGGGSGHGNKSAGVDLTGGGSGGGGACIVKRFLRDELSNAVPYSIGISGTLVTGIKSTFNGISAYGGGGGETGSGTASMTGGGGGGGYGSGAGSTGTDTVGGLPATAAALDGFWTQGAGGYTGGQKYAEYGGASGGAVYHALGGAAGGSSLYGGPGGGGGGGTDYSPATAFAGAAGGLCRTITAGGGGAGGAIGVDGTAGSNKSGTGLCGSGGGGGGGSTSTAAGAGGAGGIPGGGAGGGGSTVSGTAGAAAIGGRGEIILIEYF